MNDVKMPPIVGWVNLYWLQLGFKKEIYIQTSPIWRTEQEAKKHALPDAFDCVPIYSHKANSMKNNASTNNKKKLQYG